MAYNTGERGRATGRSSATGGSSRQYASSSRPLSVGSGSYHGPRGTRTRSRQGSRLRDGSRGGQGGYALKSRNINFQNGRGRIFGLDTRLVIIGALAVVLVILFAVGISSCVRGCSSEQQTGEVNPVDSRVAYGVSEELTQRFATELNQSEALAKVAANASAYTDTALLELALSTPEAREFVAAYPEAEKTAQAYGEDVSQGTAPQLWCWDARWGNVDYAGHALAITGSGPTALAMAYMGLTGNNDRTPADLAALATERDMASGDSSMLASFIEDAASDLGLSVSAYTSNADNLSHALEAGTYLLIETKAGTLTDSAHWVLLVDEDADGNVTVYDPTSPEVSSRTWSAASLAAATEGIYAVTKASNE